MAWKAPRREKLLIYGGFKTGKSFCYVGIMHFAQLTKTDSRFFIIDNDNAAEAIGLYPGGTYEELLGDVVKRAKGRVEFESAVIWTPRTFDEYGAIVDEIESDAEPQDWVVLDMASNLWGTMPDWWISKVYGDDPWDYYARTRKAVEDNEEGAKDRNFGGLPGGAWEYVGKAYRSLERRLTTYASCHLIAIASETEIQERFDKSGELRKKYASTSGFAPKVEKDLPHRVHTVMRMTKTLSGRDVERSLTLMGDRDREGRWAELAPKTLSIPVTNVDTEEGEMPKFAFDYLVKVGGWKLAGG